jgi:hypothetical protein
LGIGNLPQPDQPLRKGGMLFQRNLLRNDLFNSRNEPSLGQQLEAYNRLSHRLYRIQLQEMLQTLAAQGLFVDQASTPTSV